MDTFVSRRALISSLSLAAMSAGLGACGISGGRSTGLSGSSSSAKSFEQKPLVQQKLESMTLEQKVAQLFLVTPEQLTGVSQAVVAGSATQRALEDIPVGGLCYFSQNITGDQQLRDLLSGTYDMALRSGAGMAPFLAVDDGTFGRRRHDYRHHALHGRGAVLRPASHSGCGPHDCGRYP